MSLVRTEDAPKAAALVVAIIAVFGFAIWRILSLSGGGAVPEPKANPVVLAATNALIVASADASNDTEPEIDLPTLISSGAEDPFRDVVPKIVVPTATPRTPYRRPRGLRRGGSMFVSDLPILPMPTSEVLAVKIPEEEIHVSGVIAGDEAVAVMKVGTKDYVVKEGETVAGGVEVLEIDESSVTVREGHKRTKIPVGP
ncbi:hypothetical protein EON82_00660 [bacterium]|nr:MAG: hypothetical protein EON82_00660 [bacterium]